MDNEQILIPEAWTYFAHRTNTANWKIDPFAADVITVNKIMSVVTERDIYQELRDYGKNHLHGYSVGQGKPFEIRCLICNLSYLRNLDNDEIREAMMNKFYYDKENFGGMGGQRHHSIPPKEELVVLGIGNHDEVFDSDSNIIWTIPRRFIEFYKSEIQKGNVRTININCKKERNIR